MAIYSQQNKSTSIDYRRYDQTDPNRCVPFELPNDIKQSIFLLFEKLKLDSGSVDLIYSTSKKFYFLEVNPNGQFGNLSKNCNYFIEKEIANYL